jgi:cysteine desulfurase
MIYLDNAATTPVNPAALQAAWPWLTSEFGNPSSTHELGSRAHEALEDSRARIADWLGCRVSEITFTSGGTEGNNLAIIGLALANPRGKHIVSAKTEHESVLQSLDYLARVHDFEISWLPVNLVGEILAEDLAALLRPDTTLVTLMTANNEIGTTHGVTQFAQIAHQSGALFHTDAVQGAGWLDIRVDSSTVDALTVSGHKFGAPKGSGFVFIRGRLAIEPQLVGGGQESGRRSGTENVAWAVALATAIENLPELASESARATGLRDAFIRGVLEEIESAIPTGHPTNRLPGLASFCFEGVSGEAILLELERREVIVSSGSACAAGSNEPSHVLLAVGIDADTAQSAVRFSFSHATNEDELRETLAALVEAVNTLTRTGKI